MGEKWSPHFNIAELRTAKFLEFWIGKILLKKGGKRNG